MFGRFCGLDAIHVLSVFRRDSGVLLCLSWSITVADGPVRVQREPHQGLADGARQLPDVTAASLCRDAIVPLICGVILPSRPNSSHQRDVAEHGVEKRCTASAVESHNQRAPALCLSCCLPGMPIFLECPSSAFPRVGRDPRASRPGSVALPGAGFAWPLLPKCVLLL